MIVQFIFIKKDSSKLNIKDSSKLFRDMFNEIYKNVSFDSFDISNGNINETILYKSSIINSGMCYITFESKSSPAQAAKFLNIATGLLISGKHRKDFYIITSYDEPSEYYCIKLAPYFGKFERLMRSFIYTSLTKNLGFKWFEAAFTKEIKNAIKEKGNISETILIERGLYEMSFAQLYDFLFKEFSYCSAESVIYEQLLPMGLESLEKSEIIRIINQCEKKSLWDRFFINNTNFDLKEILSNIREYRNRVAHNKFITTDEYNLCRKKLDKINSTLKAAIEQLDQNIYTETHLLDSIMSLSALFASLLKSNYDKMSSIQKNFSTLGETLINAFKPYSSLANVNELYKAGIILSDYDKLITALNSNLASNKIPDFYQSLSFS